MAQIIFKNVGQGDSLLLEWFDNDGNEKIAIIDTKTTDRKNSIIEYIEQGKHTHIEFILLSHPHEDHYSGMLDLLLFIEKKGIKVGWFGHTIDSRFINKNYWKLFETSLSASIKLERILEKAIELKRSGTIGCFELPFKNWHLPLTNTFSIRALSPSHEEFELYQQKVKLTSIADKEEASQAANLLSTVLKLTNGNTHILLTSDAEKFSLERIYTENNFKDAHFSVIQVPHHGSKKNFSEILFSNMNPKNNAVISAGDNLKYKHPDIEVLNILDALKYTVHSTNICHGMLDFVNGKRKSLLLDLVSQIDERTFVGGDKHFDI